LNHQARTNLLLLVGAILGTFIFSFSASAFADDKKAGAEQFDEEEAIALGYRDNCWRCHHLTKKKEGPTYHEVAEKYRGKPEAVDKLVKHITLGKDVITLSDGHKELHKFDVKRSPQQVRNLILFILAQ
jgi:cytochrome c